MKNQSDLAIITIKKSHCACQARGNYDAQEVFHEDCEREEKNYKK